MWVIYRKSDKKVVGTSADSEHDLGKKEALEEVLRGLADAGKADDYEALQVKDRDKARDFLLKAARGQGRLVEAQGSIEIAEEGGMEQSRLNLTVEPTTGSHPVDQVPLVTAGEPVTIRLAKVDQQGKALGRAADKETLWLRTNFGTLRADVAGAGPSQEIRSVTLSNGKASFKLFPEGTQKRLATVQILSTEASLSATVRVEFI